MFELLQIIILITFLSTTSGNFNIDTTPPQNPAIFPPPPTRIWNPTPIIPSAFLKSNNITQQELVQFQQCLQQDEILFQSFTEARVNHPKQCRDCLTIRSLLNAEKIAMIKNWSSGCSDDQQCGMGWPTLQIEGTCSIPILSEKTNEIQQWVKFYDDQFDTSTFLDGFNQKCGILSFRCAIPIGEKCIDNVCTHVWEEDEPVILT